MIENKQGKEKWMRICVFWVFSCDLLYKESSPLWLFLCSYISTVSYANGKMHLTMRLWGVKKSIYLRCQY